MDNQLLHELIDHKTLNFELHDKDERILKELIKNKSILDFDEFSDSDD